MNNVNFFGFNKEIPSASNGIDLRQLVARKASNKLWGNGYILESENEKVQKIIDLLEKENKLYMFFYKTEMILSAYGGSLVTLDFSKENIPILGNGFPYGTSRIANFNSFPQGAMVWLRLTDSDNNNYLLITYTLKNGYCEIKRSFVNSYDSINAGSASSKLLEKYKLKEVTYLDIDFVPVEFIPNFPHQNFYGGGTLGLFTPDNLAVSNLQTIFNNAINFVNYELLANRTRIFGKLSPQEMQNLNAQSLTGLNPTVINERKKALENLVRSGVWIEAENGIPSASSRTIDLLIADPKFDKYLSLLQGIADMYVEGSGYSNKQDGNTQKTEFEVTVSKEFDVETNRVKKTLRQLQYSYLFEKLFKAYGCSEQEAKEFTFEIKENISIDRNKEIERQATLMNMGLQSKEGAYKSINQTSQNQTKEGLEKLQNELYSDYNKDINNENNSNTE